MSTQRNTKGLAVLLVAVAAVAFTATGAIAQQAPDEQTSDRAVYNQLVREARRAHGRYVAACRQVVDDARRGETDPKAKAEVLALRDEVDRKMNRLTLVALRYGWPIPTLDEAAIARAPATPAEMRGRAFAPVDLMIRGEMTSQAKAIAAQVHLPVVSVADAGSRDHG